MNSKSLLHLVTLSGIALLGVQHAQATINLPIVSVNTAFGNAQLLSDNPLAVSFSDNVRMSVDAAPSGSGNSMVDARFLGLNTAVLNSIPNRITIKIEGRRSRAGSFRAALYDWRADAYVDIGTIGVYGATDTVHSVGFTRGLRRFISTLGAIKVRIRSIAPGNHTVRLDHVRILVD